MPLDAVVVLVVQHGQTSFIVPLLEAFDGQTHIVLDVLQFAGLQAFVVIRLGFAAFSLLAPESIPVSSVCSGDSSVSGTGPEPSVDVNGLELGLFTAFALEIALASRSVNRSDVILLHDFDKHLELLGVFEADEVHASLPAKVAPVEPVPVLEFVPRFPPGEEVVVFAQFAVGDPLFA